MNARTIVSLTHTQPGWQVTGDTQTVITDIRYDSREVTPGTLFVALRGGYADGHAYVGTAIERGAAAVVVDHELPVNVPQIIVGDTRRDLATLSADFFGHPSRELRVTGITGTDGKTTTSYILDHILRSVGRITGMVGTVSVRIADQVIEHETRQTTPESTDIQRLLRQMVDAGVTDAILEATSHGLDLHRLDGVSFAAGAVTNITQEHLEHHRTIQNYWRAKAILFERLSENGGLAVVNLDDAGARSVLPYSGGCSRILTYSIEDGNADLFVSPDLSGIAGSRGLLSYLDTTYPFSIPLVGGFNVSNALAALGLAVGGGIPIRAALDALKTVPPIPGRLTSVNCGQPFGVIVDYAHTPESLAKVLTLLRGLRPDGRLIAVFGSAGERDAVKRPIQGRVSAELADISVITNEDPRYEDAATIVAEIAAGALAAGAVEGETVFSIVERRDAIQMAISLAQPGDTILLAGKGHEQSIIWNGVKHPWDEVTVAREELERLGWTS